MKDLQLALCPGCDRHLEIDGTASATQDALELIRDGNTPSEDSCVELNRAAHEAELQAADLDREIKRLRALSRGLQAHRERLLGFARQKRALAAPIRRLPVEILEDIFMHVCTNVCLDQWRSVVANYEAQLWKVEDVYVDLDSISYRVQWLELVEQAREFRSVVVQVLQRSAETPFSMELDCTSLDIANDWLLEDEVYESLLKAITSSVSRWRNCVIPDFLLHHVVKKGYDSCEALESLTVTEIISPGADFTFEKAPLLTEWVHHGKGTSVYPSSQILSQLTYLKTDHFEDTNFIYDIFTESKTLESLDMVHLDVYSEGFLPNLPEVALLPRLRHFSLVFTDLRFLISLLQALATPRLENLTLELDSKNSLRGGPAAGEWAWPDADFGQYLERSSCTLSRLGLVNIGITDEQESRLRAHSSIGEVVSIPKSESDA
ncbi:uncharacterized protein SCHCODRAFT_02534764 [Schizophyllum commune H4-8]|nr:uncharacterized protein SCHCODRAFT_02534764 [Schizophyllum commune H4-8]KAI5894680.1 hypothetical protein SCHCODRAFT_02534764 [Schizophyllum commune H4-8]